MHKLLVDASPEISRAAAVLASGLLEALGEAFGAEEVSASVVRGGCMGLRVVMWGVLERIVGSRSAGPS